MAVTARAPAATSPCCALWQQCNVCKAPPAASEMRPLALQHSCQAPPHPPLDRSAFAQWSCNLFPPPRESRALCRLCDTLHGWGHEPSHHQGQGTRPPAPRTARGGRRTEGSGCATPAGATKHSTRGKSKRNRRQSWTELTCGGRAVERARECESARESEDAKVSWQVVGGENHREGHLHSTCAPCAQPAPCCGSPEAASTS